MDLGVAAAHDELFRSDEMKIRREAEAFDASSTEAAIWEGP